MRTLEADTGFALSATLKRMLDCVPDGKANLAMPVRVVTASATAIEVGASLTWYRPGLACSCPCENAATVVCGLFPMSPSVGRMGTSW